MSSRRSFLKKTAASSILLSSGSIFSETIPLHSQIKTIGPNDKVKIGLIGCGIIGRIDTITALLVPGVELGAVCDLYSGRLEYAKEFWGKHIFTTKDYKEILVRKDIDAVLICVPDFWHDRISIDAMNAGKHVYCEKPMVHKISEGKAVIEAHKKSGKVFQVGSQRASASTVLKAKEIYKQGIIGNINFVETYVDRMDSKGAWNYVMPTDGSAETIDWDRFISKAPKIPFNAQHFFRWRNFNQYGTGVSGDLFVHLLTAIHTVIDSLGPTSIYALGDISYWKDGRNASDIVNAIMRYPEDTNHSKFQLVTRVNLAAGSGDNLNFRIVGTDGMIEMGWSNLKVTHFKRPKSMGYTGYNAYESFSSKQKEDFKKWYDSQYTKEDEKWTNYEPITYQAPKEYDDRLDHMQVFFNAIRTGSAIIEDAEFGLRAAAPTLAANISAATGEVIKWDPISMEII
jgi:predicted dehydrogenase